MMSSSRETLFCPIRKEYVAALPEEQVRQRVLEHMIHDRGFPASLIAVEKSLRQLPHLTVADTLQIPDRRADIICFANGLQNFKGLYPLVTIECKAVKLTSRVISQVVGYNHFVRACFVVIVNQHELRTGWFDTTKNAYEFIDYLPSYSDLLKSIQTLHN